MFPYAEGLTGCYWHILRVAYLQAILHVQQEAHLILVCAWHSDPMIGALELLVCPVLHAVPAKQPTQVSNYEGS